MTEDQGREQAKAFRGVWFDPRSGKFSAEMWVEGRRKYLGSFGSAQEAGAAYAEARAAAPRVVKASGVREAVEALVASCGGKPEAGAKFEHGGNEYTFERVEFRRVRGRPMPFWSWYTTCRACGVPFFFLTPAKAELVRSLTKNCEEHRRAWGASARREPSEENSSEQMSLLLREHGFGPESRSDDWEGKRGIAAALVAKGLFAGEREALTAVSMAIAWDRKGHDLV